MAQENIKIHLLNVTKTKETDKTGIINIYFIRDDGSYTCSRIYWNQKGKQDTCSNNYNLGNTTRILAKFIKDHHSQELTNKK